MDGLGPVWGRVKGGTLLSQLETRIKIADNSPLALPDPTLSFAQTINKWQFPSKQYSVDWAGNLCFLLLTLHCLQSVSEYPDQVACLVRTVFSDNSGQWLLSSISLSISLSLSSNSSVSLSLLSSISFVSLSLFTSISLSLSLSLSLLLSSPTYHYEHLPGIELSLHHPLLAVLLRPLLEATPQWHYLQGWHWHWQWHIYLFILHYRKLMSHVFSSSSLPADSPVSLTDTGKDQLKVNWTFQNIFENNIFKFNQDPAHTFHSVSHKNTLQSEISDISNQV